LVLVGVWELFHRLFGQLVTVEHLALGLCGMFLFFVLNKLEQTVPQRGTILPLKLPLLHSAVFLIFHVFDIFIQLKAHLTLQRMLNELFFIKFLP
jgi:hypothetical protein